MFRIKPLMLFFISALFMGVFQLVTRLLSYTVLFHEGILLLSAALFGGGFVLLLYYSCTVGTRQKIAPYVVSAAAAVIIWYQLLYLFTDHFWLHFVGLSLVFGLLFLLITHYIGLQAQWFVSVELLGSFVGAGVVIVLSTWLLEEQLLVILNTILIATLLWQFWYRQVRWLLGVVLITIVPGVYLTTTFSQHDLPSLVTCNSYKAFCLDDRGGDTPDYSLPELKGRSEVYLREEEIPRMLTVRNTGIHAGTTLHQEDFEALEYSFYDLEIPPLDYLANSEVITLGASTGANVMTFQKYIERPTITAVEIDRTIYQLYQREELTAYLPPADSFEFVFGDARTSVAKSNKTYDVLAVIVESVNSDLGVYVDEATSLVYTKEALRSYVDQLAPGGYLLLQQYSAPGEAGVAMDSKLLQTLRVATQDAELADKVIVYQYAFSSRVDAQKFTIVIYRAEGFTPIDQQKFSQWLATVQTFTLGQRLNPFNVRALHLPWGEHHASYFDAAEQERLGQIYNTTIVTDDKPFRHQVTAVPLPPSHYALFSFLTAGLALVFIRLRRRVQVPYMPACLAFGFGLITFGLQYVLFYKTAALISTNLIFFSVFLLIPLLFGALGSYFSTTISKRFTIFMMLGFVLVAVGITSFDMLQLPRWLLLGGISYLFVVAGFLFPKLLHTLTDQTDRGVIYAVNILAGGYAAVVAITLHASIGWTALFLTLAMLVVGSLGYFLLSD